MSLLSALGIKAYAPKVAEPWSTLEKRIMCPNCLGTAYVRYPWDATDHQRAQSTRNAIEEHRKICPKADVTQSTVYTINYPRV